MRVTAIKKLLPYLVDFQHIHGVSPTFREMRDAMSKHSMQTIKLYLDILEKEGYIKVAKRAHRAIKILKTK